MRVGTWIVATFVGRDGFVGRSVLGNGATDWLVAFLFLSSRQPHVAQKGFAYIHRQKSSTAWLAGISDVHDGFDPVARSKYNSWISASVGPSLNQSVAKDHSNQPQQVLSCLYQIDVHL